MWRKSEAFGVRWQSPDVHRDGDTAFNGGPHVLECGARQAHLRARVLDAGALARSKAAQARHARLEKTKLAGGGGGILQR